MALEDWIWRLHTYTYLRTYIHRGIYLYTQLSIHTIYLSLQLPYSPSQNEAKHNGTGKHPFHRPVLTRKSRANPGPLGNLICPQSFTEMQLTLFHVLWGLRHFFSFPPRFYYYSIISPLFTVLVLRFFTLLAPFTSCMLETSADRRRVGLLLLLLLPLRRPLQRHGAAASFRTHARLGLTNRETLHTVGMTCPKGKKKHLMLGR